MHITGQSNLEEYVRAMCGRDDVYVYISKDICDLYKAGAMVLMDWDIQFIRSLTLKEFIQWFDINKRSVDRFKRTFKEIKKLKTPSVIFSTKRVCTTWVMHETGHVVTGYSTGGNGEYRAHMWAIKKARKLGDKKLEKDLLKEAREWLKEDIKGQFRKHVLAARRILVKK